jgi:acyl carrier protein
MTEAEFQSLFLEFLRARHRDASLEVSATENLFNAGLLDSFAVPQLILHLETRTGRRLNLERGGLESFFTIERAFQSYAEFARKS